MRRGVIPLVAVAACHVGPTGPLTVSTAVRAERYSPDHAAWLNGHCHLVDAGGVANVFFRGAIDGVNFRLDVVALDGIFTGAMSYACAEDPPWPASPHDLVGSLLDRLHTTGFACVGSKPSGESHVEIVDAGSGDKPSATSFVAVRIHTIAVEAVPVDELVKLKTDRRVYHGRVLSKPFHFQTGPLQDNYAHADDGPKPHEMIDVDQPTLLYADHITCVDRSYGGAASQLAVGGKARVTLNKVVLANGYPEPDRVVEIELVAVGDESLVRHHFGL